MHNVIHDLFVVINQLEINELYYNMQWIELIIAGLVGLVTSLSLNSFILQATSFGRRMGEVRTGSAARGSGIFGLGLAKAMVLVFCVLGVLLESNFFLTSE